MAKIHTITSAHERELLTIWRNRSRLNISCANCRNFRRQRAIPTGVSDMPVFASPYKIERFRKRQRDKLDRHVSNTAQAIAILVRIEPSWVLLLEMGRLVATKKRNRAIHADLCCQKLTAGFSILREYSARWEYNQNGWSLRAFACARRLSALLLQLFSLYFWYLILLFHFIVSTGRRCGYLWPLLFERLCVHARDIIARCVLSQISAFVLHQCRDALNFHSNIRFYFFVVILFSPSFSSPTTVVPSVAYIFLFLNNRYTMRYRL